MPDSSVVALGSINTDLVIKGPRLPQPGETVLGGQFYQAAGGKGANQAVAAARAGREPVTFLAAVGDDDYGRAARERLSREAIRCDWIKTVPGQPSGVALIMVDAAGQNCISVASGANLHLLPEDITAVPEEVFRTARVFLACLESPLETVLCGLQRAKHAGLTTILNPAPAAAGLRNSSVFQHVDILTPNEPEAGMLTGTEVTDRKTAVRAGRILQQMGCPRSIVTLGSKGCLAVDEETTFVEARPVRAADSTAAGDAFNGSLAVALAEGRSLVEAARWAAVAAAISVTRPGAQPSLPTRAEIEAGPDALNGTGAEAQP
jgi:ribokinase